PFSHYKSSSLAGGSSAQRHCETLFLRRVVSTGNVHQQDKCTKSFRSVVVGGEMVLGTKCALHGKSLE
ncbi:unnamed protein product, partial [Ceratitis capitata]